MDNRNKSRGAVSGTSSCFPRGGKSNKLKKKDQVSKEQTEGTSTEDGKPLLGPSNNHGIARSLHNDGIAGSSNTDETLYFQEHVTAASALPKENSFPFENLVFEGGGNKALAYVGCLKYLEEMNVMHKIRRVAGTSAGAITAALVALGYTAQEIEGFLSENVQEVFLDHSFGYLSLLPNLVRKFGWNPGKKIFKWFGDKIKLKSKTSNSDMTFLELYKERDHMELCVVVTNINQMRTEYCHPKTTPHMPIRVALRMSMAIPGIFAAQKYDNHGQLDIYVDGGMLCNYPIHCFDGWFLSMNESDSFFKKVNSLCDLMDKENFTSFNDKTLGFLLYDDTEREVLRLKMDERADALIPREPKAQTKLYKRKEENSKKMKEAEDDFKARREAKEVLFKILKKHNHSGTVEIDKVELEKALKDENFVNYKPLLFGKDESVETIFNTLDVNRDGKISFSEFMHFYEGYSQTSSLRKDVTSFKEYLSAVQNTLLMNMKRVYVTENDLKRTVGINTGYVGTSDYVLEEEDRRFIVERGQNSTKAFFNEYPEMQ